MLQFIGLPALEKSVVAVSGAVDGEIQEITIANTALRSVAWVVWPVGTAVNISSNTHLESFTIPYHAINSGSQIIFSDNQRLKTLDFGAVTKIPGGLQLSGNAKLTNLSFPALETIEGFVRVSGDFTNVSMPLLESIGGSLYVSITGDSTNVAMPTLRSINGGLQIDATGDISPLCDYLQEKRLGAHSVCISNRQAPVQVPFPSFTVEPTGLATDTFFPTASAGPKSSEGAISTGVIIGIIVAAIVFALLLGILGFIFFRRRSRTKSDNKEKAAEVSDSNRISRAPRGIEMADTSPGTESNPNEMMGYTETSELDGASDVTELYTPDTTPMAARKDSWRSDVPLVRYELPG